MAFITQFYTWATGNTITAARLNGNISNLIDGLDGGTSDINIAKLQISGTDIIDGSENITNTGDITGTSSSTAKPVWTLKNTNADATSSEIQFYKLSASPADNDDVGKISFYGDDDGTNKTLFGQILAESTDVTDATEDGKITFYTMTAGTSTATLTLASSVTTINAACTITGALTLSSTLTDGTATLDGSGNWSGIANLTMTGALDSGTGNITTGGILKVDVDGTAENAAGSLTLGAGNDAGIFFDGTDLVIITNGAGASGIILDSEDDTVEIKGSGTLQATFDTGGLNLVTGDAYEINGTSVLNATTLGSAVVASSLTSVGTLTSLTVSGASSLDGGIDTGDNIQLKFKTIDIGDWNMDSTTDISVAHGLTLSTIRFVSITIRNDADSAYYPISGRSDTTAALDAQIRSLNSTNVTLRRSTGGPFDGTDYDSTSYNRGWITIWYTA